LVKEGRVRGWDDPRMPTLAGMRRRGYTAEAVRNFIERVGIAKKDNSVVDIALLEHSVREDLNKHALRVMGVLNPLKVIITNYPADQVEHLEAVNNPEDETAGSRTVPFSREIYIEQDDFKENPPNKWFRLAPGMEVRLKHAYYVTCTNVIKNDHGDIVELHCTYDPQTRGGWSQDGRKIKGTLHWVSARHSCMAEVRLYDRLFTVESPGKDADFLTQINPNSLEILSQCRVEQALIQTAPEARFQFERQGYFCADRFEHTSQRPVFNRTVTLRDSWTKAAG